MGEESYPEEFAVFIGLILSLLLVIPGIFLFVLGFIQFFWKKKSGRFKFVLIGVGLLLIIPFLLMILFP